MQQFSAIFRKQNIPLFIASLLFALATVYDYRRQEVTLVTCIGCFIFAAVVFFAVEYLLCHMASKKSISFVSGAAGTTASDDDAAAGTTASDNGITTKATPSVSGRTWLIFFLVIFCLYFINWLINYPMTATNDTTTIVRMGLGETEIAAWHPLIWVLIVVFFVKAGVFLGDVNTGLAILTFIQFTIVSGILSYTCAWLRARGVPKGIALLVLFAFAFNPVIAQYSVYVTKDCLFAAFTLLLFLLLFDVVKSKALCLKSNSFLARFALICLLVCMFRLNGLYVVLALLVILLAAYRRQAWKRITPLFAIPLALLLITGPGYDALGIEKSPFSESGSVPLAQVGYVIAQGESIDEDSAELLNNILPLDEWAQVYQPRSTNSVKYHEDFDIQYLEDHKVEFLKVWLKIGIHNAGAYFDAWCLLTEGYWNIDSTDWIAPEAKQYPTGSEEQSGLETGNDDLYKSSGVLSKITGLDFLNHDVGKDWDVLKNSKLLYPFFNNATLLWLFMLLTACSFALGRKWRAVIPYLVLLLIVATILIASPIWCEFRYIFALHLCAPAALVLFFTTYAGNAGKAAEVVDADSIGAGAIDASANGSL